MVASGAVRCPSGVVAASSGNILCQHLSQVADTGQPKRSLCQSGILSGTLRHADRVVSAAGCMSQTCKVIVTGRSAEVS